MMHLTGSEAAVVSLQHFMGWQHPTVRVVEVNPAICRQAYQVRAP